VTDREVIISKLLKRFQKNSKKRKKLKLKFLLIFSKIIFFKKITEITCAYGIVVPMAHHGRRPIAMPMVKPVPTAIWPMPTVAVGTDCADGIFSCADGQSVSRSVFFLINRSSSLI
jgi:hypothetical protein